MPIFIHTFIQSYSCLSYMPAVHVISMPIKHLLGGKQKAWILKNHWCHFALNMKCFNFVKIIWPKIWSLSAKRAGIAWKLYKAIYPAVVWWLLKPNASIFTCLAHNRDKILANAITPHSPISSSGAVLDEEPFFLLR